MALISVFPYRLKTEGYYKCFYKSIFFYPLPLNTFFLNYVQGKEIETEMRKSMCPKGKKMSELQNLSLSSVSTTFISFKQEGSRQINNFYHRICFTLWQCWPAIFHTMGCNIVYHCFVLFPFYASL